MSKVITKQQLSQRKAQGAKVQTSSTVPEVPPAPTPQPLPDNTESLTEMVGMMTAKTIDSMKKAEEMMANNIAISDANMRAVVAAVTEALTINSRSSSPVPYDLIIKRRRDGLIETVRLQPVVEDKGFH